MSWYITEEDYLLAEEHGITRNTLNSRVRSCGWNLKRACTTPLQRTLKQHLPKETVELLAKNSISIELYSKRLKAGWSEEEACSTPAMSKIECIRRANAARRTITDDEYARAEANGISRSTLKQRINRSRWSMEKAINTPVMSMSECAALSAFSKSFNYVSRGNRSENCN